MNKTANYQLNQWVKSDQVKMEDFNADNAKIDAAIKAVDQKADGKADAAALSSLSGTVAGHTSALAKRGNCQIYTTTYTGDGAKSRKFTFPNRPLLAAIFGLNDNTYYLLGYGVSKASEMGSSLGWGNVSWSGNSFTLSSSESASWIMNLERINYRVVALLAMD